MSAIEAARPDWWRAGLSILAGRGGDTLLRVALFPATALVLSREEFSVYALLTAALATGQALLALGAPRAAVFFHRRGERGSLFAWLFALALLPSAAAAALLVAFPAVREFWFAAVPARLFWIGVAPLPFLLVADSLAATLLASRRERLYAFFLWSRTLGVGLVLLTSLAAADRLLWVLAGRLAVAGLAAAGLVAATGARPSWTAVSSLAGPALRFGAPVAVAGVFVALHRRADVFLLSALGQTSEIGAYALAYAIAESLWILTDSLEAALFVELSGRPAAEARRLAEAALTRFRLLTVAAGLAILAGGEAVLFLLFRGRYPAAAALLPPVIVGVVAWGSTRPLVSYLYAAGRGAVLPARHAAALLVNAALCLTLVPRYGAYGAALATLGSYALLAGLITRAFRRSEP